MTDGNDTLLVGCMGCAAILSIIGGLTVCAALFKLALWGLA